MAIVLLHPEPVIMQLCAGYYRGEKSASSKLASAFMPEATQPPTTEKDKLNIAIK
jgi:hypothetical protein